MGGGGQDAAVGVVAAILEHVGDHVMSDLHELDAVDKRARERDAVLIGGGRHVLREVGLEEPLPTFRVRDPDRVAHVRFVGVQRRRAPEVQAQMLVGVESGPVSATRDLLLDVGFGGAAPVIRVQVQAHLVGQPERHTAEQPTPGGLPMADVAISEEDQGLHKGQIWLVQRRIYEALGLISEDLRDRYHRRLALRQRSHGADSIQ